ncbi:YbfB/YjiJ family MFS transporter [Roseomonas haemaphysalidis]|uniref:YbfB/YjiJ family MFS transporter n=1 Tax=Roseomonas haemaphysalidis TaxID=2768162 RepID=A0ABS3KPM5_9PROT|nr:YbfB/YjiJ family MFS transporter [Roseomonas haemaphysalidis]MBO1079395.1 YbfB/YjiJ family MFS transporter [Roseomonas haemaphysalidis]
MRARAAALAAPLAAGASLLSGIGLARFGYVPLFPAMVAAGWVGGGGAGMLGACNFTGYLLGALGGRTLGRRLGVPAAMDLGMALVVLSFLACAWQGGLGWLALWRTVAGLAGGLLMALAGPAAQAVVPPARRALAGGVLTSGVGCGVVVGALAVPALLAGGGVTLAWLGLGVLAALAWLLARPRWPDPPPETLALPRGLRVPPSVALLLAYALSAAGMVAPMVYSADLAVRGHGAGPAMVSLLWVLFGVGGFLGTLSAGAVAGRIGAMPAMALWLLVQVAALSAALVPPGLGDAAILVAAPLSGFAGIGISAVALAGTREAAGAASGALWVRATAVYALSQAGFGFALAALFRWSGESHAAVFGAGLGFSVAGLLVAGACAAWGRRSSR